MRVRGSLARASGVALVALSLGACAIYERGAEVSIPVSSDPPGASVTTPSGMVCTTPCSVSAPRKDSVTVSISKTGYQTATVTSEAKPAANFEEATRFAPSFDALGRVADAQAGAVYVHTPGAIFVKLDRAE